MIVAERRAHDDRTTSLVVAAVHDAFIADPGVAPDAVALAERQFNDRLAAYRDALRARTREPAGTRGARVLLAFAGALRVARGEGLHAVAALVSQILGRTETAFDRTLTVRTPAVREGAGEPD